MIVASSCEGEGLVELDVREGDLDGLARPELGWGDDVDRGAADAGTG